MAGSVGRIDEELQFVGVDEQHGIIVRQPPRVTIGGPPATDDPNAFAITCLVFVRIGLDAVDPQFRRHRTEVHREALAVEV